MRMCQCERGRSQTDKVSDRFPSGVGEDQKRSDYWTPKEQSIHNRLSTVDLYVLYAMVKVLANNCLFKHPADTEVIIHLESFF